MKYLCIGLLSLMVFNTNGQDMKNIEECISRLFIATDNRDWEGVDQCFAKQIELDYSSMTGQPAAVLTSSQIIEGWKSILPGFESTHHQLGNIIVIQNGDKATVFCYGTATHYLPQEGGNLWTVVGSYDFDMVRKDKVWKVSKMKFNYKYQTGNTELPQAAINVVKNGK